MVLVGPQAVDLVNVDMEFFVVLLCLFHERLELCKEHSNLILHYIRFILPYYGGLTWDFLQIR